MFYIDHGRSGVPSPFQKYLIKKMDSKNTHVVYEYPVRRAGTTTAINNFISKQILLDKQVVYISNDKDRFLTFAETMYDIKISSRNFIQISPFKSLDKLYGYRPDICIVDDCDVKNTPLLHMMNSYTCQKLCIFNTKPNPKRISNVDYFSDILDGTLHDTSKYYTDIKLLKSREQFTYSFT